MKTTIILLFCLAITVSSMAQNHKDSTKVTTDSNRVLSDQEKEILKQEALKLINSFQSCLCFIASKANSIEAKQIYKELALDKFINKGNGITREVSSISLVTKLVSIKKDSLIQYLDSLSLLPYSKVELKEAKTSYVSNWLKSGMDNNGNPIYKAMATYYLEFTGYDSKGNEIYKDLTENLIEVEISYTTDLDGARWIVSLGDISITETK